MSGPEGVGRGRRAVRGRPVGSPKGLPKHTPLRQEMNKGRPLEPALNCNGRAGPCAPVQRVPAPPAPGPVWHRGPGNPPKLLLSPDLCASRGLAIERLPPACGRVYSPPSRRTPVDAAARTPRTGYCGRRRRSDGPFRTGLQRWLEEEEILPRAPVFHEFLESICFFNFKVLLWTESSILAQDERWRRA